MQHWRQVKVQETAAAIKAVGAQNFVLATDLGRPATRHRPTGCRCSSSSS
jgi:hypothetical protein